MHKIKLYSSYNEAIFFDRPNRFTLLLKKNKKIIKTYIQNTGRMDEFLVSGAPFYYVPVKTKKYNFKTIGTKYQGSYVFLETTKINDIFELLVQNNIIPQFYRQYKREITIKNSRFDFGFFKNGSLHSIVELKSCTLCHNHIALFPDAPTERGKKHIIQLNNLTQTKNFIIYLISNHTAKSFFPNFHTDSEYVNAFLNTDHLHYMAYSIKFLDPITVNLDTLKRIKIRKKIVEKNTNNKGSYVLLLFNPKKQKIQIGKLGDILFKQGYYVYVGSALHSLDSRISHHKNRKKKNHWHIDYFLSHCRFIKAYPIKRLDRIESNLTQDISKFATSSIPQFGATDTKDNSHLFYFKTNPTQLQRFHNIILNYRTFTERGK